MRKKFSPHSAHFKDRCCDKGCSGFGLSLVPKICPFSDKYIIFKKVLKNQGNSGANCIG